jgi:hypothetical protein
MTSVQKESPSPIPVDFVVTTGANMRSRSSATIATMIAAGRLTIDLLTPPLAAPVALLGLELFEGGLIFFARYLLMKAVQKVSLCIDPP